MSNVHMVIGTLVIIGYLVNLVYYGATFLRGRVMPYHRAIAFGAATLLLLQYMLGFSLLGEGKDIPAVHFLVALAAVIPVGAEHMLAGQEPGLRRRGMIGMLASFVTLVLVLVAYMIGETNT
jgi:hypothetical protein